MRVTLFPLHKIINYNYMNNCLDNYFYNCNYIHSSSASYLRKLFVDQGNISASPLQLLFLPPL